MMNNKKLAEMIKRLREEKLKQIGSGGSYVGSGADIQDPASPNRSPGKATKEIHHGIVKETMRDPPPAYKRLTPDQHQGAIRGGIIRSRRNLAGRTVRSKYTFEEKEKSSNTKSTFINTTPENDSAMAGTQ